MRPRLPSTLATLRGIHFEREDAAPPTPRLAVFAVGWFLYTMSCRVKMCCHRAASMMTGHSRAFCQYQSCAAHANTRSGANAVRFDSDSYPVGVDGHASCCMGNHPDQFEDLQLTTDGKSVSGIGSSVIIKGMGTFKFNIEDDTGQVHTIRIPNSLYVPSLKRVLLSPHHWAQEAHDNHPQRHGTFMAQYDDGIVLHWNQRQCSRSVPYLPSTNTPVFLSAPGARSYRTYVAVIEALRACTPHFRKEQVIQLTSQLPTMPEDDEFIAEENLLLPDDYFFKQASEEISVDDDTVKHDNLAPEGAPADSDVPPIARMGPLSFDPRPSVEQDDDLTASDDQTELMRWHYRLGHLSFVKLKALAILGEIPKRLARVTPPLCAGCAFATMTKVPWQSKGDTSAIFTATKPGQCVSVDHMESTQVGFIAQLKGILTRRRYRAATVFVDHFSGYKYIHLMGTLSSEETVAAKVAFERHASELGVSILHYHADNGRFQDNAFRAACEQGGQRLTFCGVNAHFQNGRAEKAIRDLSESARKQLLHAQARWPDAIHLALWPYALRMAVSLHNDLPTLDGGISRYEMFSSIHIGVKLGSRHVFGAPVFALDNELASGGSLPRWAPRCRLGINLGPSPSHARNVSLVLNPDTGCVSPQYHCRFDNFFESVEAQEVSISKTWQQLAGLSTLPLREPSASVPSSHHSIEHVHPAPTHPVSDGEPQEPELPVEPSSALPASRLHAGVSLRGRVQTMTQAMADSIEQQDLFSQSDRDVTAFEATSDNVFGESDEDREHTAHLSIQDRMRHPVAFWSEMCGDVMHFGQAMKQPDRHQFVEAVVKEVNGHVDNQNFKLIRRSEVPEGEPIQQSVWAMRRKRNLTTGEITKHKARLNLHGGMQEFGVNYYDTYSPVVTWFAIRLMIMFAILFSQALRQVDFVMAYPQAPIEMDMYMELPQGIQTEHGNSKDHVLKVLRNIYGQKQAGRVWNQFLTSKLLGVGFTQSLVDDCVYYRGNTIFIVYVDDGIFIGDSDEHLMGTIAELQNLGLKIEDQGHPADYVGVNIKKLASGGFEFTQRALIESIISDVGVAGTPSKPVPAKAHVILTASKDQPKFALSFDYRSVTGKLNYLAQTSRPDIMYAVHQIARFSADPREPHGEAILYLARYLMKTRLLGIRFQPDPTKGFECYCDVDFSGNWNKSLAARDPSTSKSRSGWIIFYAGCPIIWASKLQSQVALSTTEAEYIALSMSLRDVLPIMFLLKEMREQGHAVICTDPHVFCKVFEDNSGALELARLPKLRPRTKHINVCYHHFREHVRSRLVKIYPVSTHDQVADTLTKALSQNAFQKHRRAMCGQ